MREVIIAGYLRTAQTRSTLNDPSRDWFYKLRADDLLSKVIPELIHRTCIDPIDIDDFVLGCALGVNEQWTYGGRTPIFLANLPESIPAKFIDQQCGSSMAGIHVGFMEIATGFADIVLVGGLEHMARVPNGGSTIEKKFIVLNERLFRDPKYKHWDMMTAMNMGLTAEKLFQETNFTRDDLDRFAVGSHQLAANAQEDGFFDDEILPIEAEQADGTMKLVGKDQAVRKNTSFEVISGLKPVFKKEGVMTAGNSSPMSTGAAAMLLMSKDTATKKNIEPMATIRSIGFAGVHPANMGIGPIPATRMALEKANLKTQNIDYWEINEAFCIVALNYAKELGINLEQINIMGGATAIGHPLGVSGIRLVGTLARILRIKGKRYGCASACVGGGQGVATIIERESYNG